MHSYINKTPLYYLYTPFQHVSTLKGPSSESKIDTFQWHLAAGMCTAEMYTTPPCCWNVSNVLLEDCPLRVETGEVTYNVNKEEFNNI